MTAPLTADEAAALRVGVNVIVRPGEPRTDQPRFDGYRAPQDWVALTGPCPRCNGTGRCIEPPVVTTYTCPSPDCRDGRKLTDFGNGVKAIVVSVEPEPDGRNWRITLEVPE